MTARPRRGGVGQMAVDLVRFSFLTRSWALLFVVVFGLLALMVGAVVQLALPWAIYPFV
jgi:hypothetical protein